MHRVRGRLGVLALVAVSVAGCGGGGGTTSPGVDVTGTYRVNGFSNTVGRFTATATIQQNGGAITGTYRNGSNTFRVDGTVSGTHVRTRLIGTNNPIVCDAEGDFLPDGREGTGSFTCRAGSQTETGTITISRIG